MSATEQQKAFALATLESLQGLREKTPHPADFGVDYFSAAAIQLLVQRVFDESVLARTRALASYQSICGKGLHRSVAGLLSTAGPVGPLRSVDPVPGGWSGLYADSLDA